MMEWWQETRKRLEVQADIHIDEAPESPSPVRIAFLIANTYSSGSANHPQIVFNDVKLVVDNPPIHEEFLIGTLLPGESKSFDFMCEYGDVTELKYEASGNISPEAFFGIRSDSTKVHVDSISLPVKAYLQIYEAQNIQEAGLGAIKAISVPGPDTTLAEVTSLSNTVSEMMLKLRESKEKVERTAGVVNRGQRAPVLQHQNTVSAYIDQVVGEFQKVGQALQTNSPNAVESAIAHAVERLEGGMERLQKATDALQA